MFSSLIVSSLLLTLPAQAERRSRSVLGGTPPARAEAAEKKPAARAEAAEKKPAARAEAAESSAAALAQYNELKAKTPKTAGAQSKLAAWCEEHGLKAEAYVHYAEVVRLDPKREAAWRKLGYKKYGKRWMTDAQIAELEDLKQWERVWLPQLKRIHRDIHGSNGAKKRDAAIAAFEAIRDEKAVPSLYREFIGGQTDQILLIEALARIDRTLATKVLAMLAVYGQTPEVRRRATEVLRGRPSEDYLELLVDLMLDPLKYEVKPVGGPGSPGILFVEGEQFNVARFYAPPPPPNVVPQPGDIISYDQFGMPVIDRYFADLKVGVPGSSTMVFDFKGADVRISATQMMLEAQKGAQAAEAQLEGDVAQVKAINAARRHFSELVMAVASYATGKTIGTEPEAWRKAVGAQDAKTKYPTKEKPTVTELVPMAYKPAFSQILFMKVRLVADS
jgi:hypothetical protein